MHPNRAPPDPDRHLKRLHKVFEVSKRLQNLATRRHASPTKITKEQKERELLGRSKELRTARQARLQATHRHVLELCAEHFGLDADTVEAGLLDDDLYVRLVDEFVLKGGRMAVLFFYDEFAHPNVASGRHVPAQRHTKMRRVVCSDGTDLQQRGKCVVVYKLNNDKDLDLRTIQDVSLASKMRRASFRISISCFAGVL